MPNSHCLEPYDAFMLVSYGGPNGPDDVIPFLRNATGGAGIPDERLAEVGTHYGLFGGVSPINQKNAELLEALRQRLDPQGRIPFVIGNRNWHPYFSEALLDLVDQGCRRILTLFTSAYTSYSGCRQYRENLAAALEEVRAARPEVFVDGFELELGRARPFANTPGFVTANANAIKAAFEDLGPGEKPHLVMVTHSIPEDMARCSGAQVSNAAAAGNAAVAAQVSGGPRTGDGNATTEKPAIFEDGRRPEVDLSRRVPDLEETARAGFLAQTQEQDVLGQGWGYVAQHLAVAGAIVRELREKHGIDLEWSLAFCSRSGPPQAKWLEPDINDHLETLQAAGTRRVIASPFGFICDHMEVVFDLDTEAAQTAAQLGLEYRRAATAQDDAAFLDQVARVVAERAAQERGEAVEAEVAAHTYPPLAEICGENCCKYVNVHGRPHRHSAGAPAADSTEN